MPGSSNFLQWNNPKNNQETDAQWAADAQRQSGAASPSEFAASRANKAFYQWSTFITALAAALAAKGFTVSDADLTALTAVLANVITTPDLVPFATLANPHFTGDPQCPTPATGDNDNSVANTAFVKAVLGASGGFVFQQTLPGYIKFPSALGGFILQWAVGDTGGSPQVNMVVPFPLPFPTGALAVLNAARTGTQTSSINFSGQNWLLTGNGTYWLFAIGR